MELLQWSLYYVVILIASIAVAFGGLKLGAYLSMLKKAARRREDLKVLDEMEGK